jgi:hypothetical protein
LQQFKGLSDSTPRPRNRNSPEIQMKQPTAPSPAAQARAYLTEWLIARQRVLRRGRDSVTAQVEVNALDRRLPKGVMISFEAWEEALHQTYCELHGGMASHTAWGVDQELGVVSRRAVRRLARDRERDRIRDHLTRRRDASQGLVVHAARLDHPVEQAQDDGGEPLIRAEVTGDERVNVVAEVINRELIGEIRARPRQERAVLFAKPLLGLTDTEVGRALDEPPARLRKRRERLLHDLNPTRRNRRSSSAHRNR